MNKIICLLAFLIAAPAMAQDYACMNQAKSVAEKLMVANRESIKKDASEINFVKRKSNGDNNVFQIVGVDSNGDVSTVGYEMTMNLSGCVVTKFELIGAE